MERHPKLSPQVTFDRPRAEDRESAGSTRTSLGAGLLKAREGHSIQVELRPMEVGIPAAFRESHGKVF
eukprot:3218168-Pyramimonas_sp.AAC.1